MADKDIIDWTIPPQDLHQNDDRHDVDLPRDDFQLFSVSKPKSVAKKNLYSVLL